jgi:hypothetical protein
MLMPAGKLRQPRSSADSVTAEPTASGRHVEHGAGRAVPLLAVLGGGALRLILGSGPGESAHERSQHDSRHFVPRRAVRHRVDAGDLHRRQRPDAVDPQLSGSETATLALPHREGDRHQHPALVDRNPQGRQPRRATHLGRALHRGHYKGDFPAPTLVEIPGLARPDFLVEIEVIAAMR